MNTRAFDRHKGPPRAFAAALSLAIQAGVVTALVYGLAPDFAARTMETFTAVALDTPPNPPQPPPPQPTSPAQAAAGKASPANLRAKAAEVFAAPQPIPLPVPIHAAVSPAVGSADHSGAALVPGPGSGAGGAGTGSGSGNSGDGEGDGGDDAEWTGGKIKNSDYPKSARSAHRQGTTTAEITVSSRGRPSGCRIARSSGDGDLDATTCRLALQRFRFRPATDRAGNPVAGAILYDQEWVLTGAWDGMEEPPPE